MLPHEARPGAGKERLTSRAALERFRERLQARRAEEPRPLISICGGSGCAAYGTDRIHEALKAELEARGLESAVAVKLTGCHGYCQKGPLLVLYPEGVFYPQVKEENLPEIIEKTIGRGEVVESLAFRDPLTRKPVTHERDIPFYRLQQREVFGLNSRIDPARIEDYIAEGGYRALAKALWDMTPEAIVGEVKRAGLRGRGGGGFPTGAKWESCRRHPEPRYVICNGDEGDPGAYMDGALMEANPHLILEGMIIGALALASHDGHIYVRHEYPRAVRSLTTAVGQARVLGLLGRDILGSGYDFDLRISRGGGAFVCGESTALMASLEGKPGRPRAKYIHTVEKGFRQQPSVLNNVESWANVPLIINRGADWYASIGTETSKGTKIFSLVGKVVNTGLVEVPMGTTLRTIIFEIGGGIPRKKKFKAVQTGGPSGGCIPEQFLDLQVDFDALAKVGSIMGSGGMIRKFSLCGLGTSAPNPVLTTIQYFRGEYEAHIRDRQCPAGVCKPLFHYEIDPAGCTGCRLCALKCPQEAISGEKKQAHCLDQAKCVKCGICYEACKFDAVVIR